jgi:hypothetical protein
MNGAANTVSNEQESGMRAHLTQHPDLLMKTVCPSFGRDSNRAALTSRRLKARWTFDTPAGRCSRFADSKQAGFPIAVTDLIR